MNYALELFGTMLVWASIGVCFALPVDRGRMFLVCPAALCATGAYSAALISNGVSILLVIAVAGIGVGVLCLLLARLWHDELIVGSFAMQMIVFQGLKATNDVTGGDQGLRSQFGGDGEIWVWVACATLLIVMFVLLAHRRSTLDAVATTVGRDPVWAASAAIHPTRARLIILGLAAGGAVFAGAIWAGLKGYLTPGDFDLFTSVQMLLVVLIAGRFGQVSGALLGAGVVVLLPELIRSSGLFSNALAGHAERIVFGVLLVVWALFAGREARQTRSTR